MAELKPCPFCGNEYPTIHYSKMSNMYSMACPQCQIYFSCENVAGAAESAEKTIDHWNRRADDLPTPANHIADHGKKDGVHNG